MSKLESSGEILELPTRSKEVPQGLEKLKLLPLIVFFNMFLKVPDFEIGGGKSEVVLGGGADESAVSELTLLTDEKLPGTGAGMAGCQ